jgi:tRNA nucleotidyltransferase (CCA-adding enzyme)
MRIYLVGGAVRDQLLGQPVTERDWVVVGATPQDMLAQGFKQVGRDFPVFIHPETREEYALARQERKTGLGYHGFDCKFDPNVTLEEDLLRRDLTINAMALDDQGKLIDPYGGEKDLNAKLLRHVSLAFVEDPLRVLRLARFKARFHHLGFSVAEETQALMYRMVKQNELNTLTPERVWQEWEKSLHTLHPAQFVLTLRKSGALSIILPELEALFGVPAKPTFHPEIDTGIHTLEVVESLREKTDDAKSLFAAWVHDLGKAKTPKEQWPAHADHDANGEPVLLALCERLKVPSAFRERAKLVMRYHLKIHRAVPLTPEKRLSSSEVLDALIATGVFRQHSQLEAVLQVCEADVNGCLTEKGYVQRDFWLSCAKACLAIQTDPWVKLGWSGQQIQQALRQARLEALDGKMEIYEK